MSKREKLRRKLRNQPADATMQDVETLLARFGFSLARTSGSHHIFEHGATQIVVPLHGRKVKKVYVQQVVALLDEIFPPELEPGEEGEDEPNA